MAGKTQSYMKGIKNLRTGAILDSQTNSDRISFHAPIIAIDYYTNLQSLHALVRSLETIFQD